jgi:hypothetical protein
MNYIHNGVRYKLEGFSSDFAKSLKDREFSRGVRVQALGSKRFAVAIADKGTEIVRGVLHDSVGANLGELLNWKK